MPLSRRALLAAIPALAAYAPSAHALKVGGMLVEPLVDGIFPLTLDMIPAANNEEGQKLLAAAGIPAAGPDPIPVNGFVVRRLKGITLVDSGAGGLFGPELGKLPDRLAAMGVESSKVGMIVLTHLHPDHAGGLVLEDGKPRFPNATLVIQADEAAYWTSDANRGKAPPAFQSFFATARTVLDTYKGRRWMMYGPGQIAPGLTAVAMPGHTPGHVGVMVADGRESLLILGDVVHSAALQLPHPEWSVAFDVDPAAAAAARARVLDMAATDKLRVAGSHMAMQGRVEKRGTGYALVPLAS